MEKTSSKNKAPPSKCLKEDKLKRNYNNYNTNVKQLK